MGGSHWKSTFLLAATKNTPTNLSLLWKDSWCFHHWNISWGFNIVEVSVTERCVPEFAVSYRHLKSRKASMSLSHKNGMYESLFPTNATTLAAHAHRNETAPSITTVFLYTNSTVWDKKEVPGGLHWFHMGDLKPHMSLLGQNSKYVYFLFAVALREICIMGATVPEAIADRSAVLRKGSCVPTPVDSWVGTYSKLSLSVPLYIPSSPVNPSLKKQEDNLHFPHFIWI